MSETVNELPSGCVTFLFTDVVGSTRLWARDPEAMSAALREHDRILIEIVANFRGAVFSMAGDSFAVAFSSADDAVGCATEIQAVLAASDWRDWPQITVRIGLHSGVAEERDGNYFGPPVNQAARVMRSAHGGQSIITDAVKQQTSAETTDLGIHLLRDIDTPVRLHQLGRSAFPPLESTGVGSSSLPSPRTSLIGRVGAIKTVHEILQSNRLVTLIGSGGCGKTRLAIEVAHRQAPAHPDGVWFVDLTSIADRSGLPGAFAAAFGLSLAIGSSASDEIVNYLTARRALIVVDNCEHIIDDLALFVDELLERCPRLQILATSREALSIDGEFAWRVPSLPTGIHSAAVQLFVERAGAIGTEIVLDEDASRTIAEIVTRLDGIPLAIELAAATTRTFEFHQIRDRLDDRFSLLTGGSTRSERKVTLEGAVQWSYDLLSDREKRMLRLLSVFQGGFAVEDAAAVSDFEEPEARTLVTSLAEKSLVDVSRDDSGYLRHRLLETIRLFAQTRLIQHDEVDRVRDEHLSHFSHDPVSITYDSWASFEGIERIWREYENFRSAAVYATDRGRPELAARIGAVISDAAVVRGEVDVVITWMRSPDTLKPLDRILVHSFLGWVLLLQFDTDDAIIALDDAIAAGDDNPSDFVVGALLYKGLWATIRAQTELDRDSIDAAEHLALTRYGGNSRGTVVVAKAARLATRFRFEEILEICDDCIESAPQYGYRHIVESFRVWALLRTSHVVEAANAVAEFSPIPRGSRWEIMNLSSSLAVLAHTTGPTVAATELAAIGSELVSRRPEMDQEILECFAYFAHLRGDEERAQELAASVVTAGGLGIGHWVQFSYLGMTNANADQMIARFNEAHPLDQRLGARDANRRRLLREELERWHPDSGHGTS